MTCLQHKVFLLTKHSVHLPCMLFVDFLFTLLFSVNLVPIMSLKFLFWQKAKLGDFEIFQLDKGLYAEDGNIFITIFFILGSVLLYLIDKGMVVAVSFFQKFFSFL